MKPTTQQLELLKRIKKSHELIERGLIEIILWDETMIQAIVRSVNSKQREHLLTYDYKTVRCPCSDYDKGHSDCYHKIGLLLYLNELLKGDVV